MERNFKPTELISVLLLYVYVADGFRIAVAKGKFYNALIALNWSTKEVLSYYWHFNYIILSDKFKICLWGQRRKSHKYKGNRLFRKGWHETIVA